jgi:c-di-GMP-binding flagellar brake protein YcgR
MTDESFERRRYRRIQAPIYVRPARAAMSTPRWKVGDISRGGLRAFSDDKHVPGERLEMELFFPDETSVTAVVEIVWIDCLPQGAPARYDIGFRFVKVNPSDLGRIESVLGS